MTNTNYPSTSPSTPGNPREPKTTPRQTKNILIGVLAVGLLGTWGYVLYSQNKTKDTIVQKEEKIATVTTQYDEIRSEYDIALNRLDSITGTNNNLQGQLGDSQGEIAQLKMEINKILRNKNATDGDLKKARNMISQLNGKINNLEAEVARLTGENQQLATTNTTLKQEKEVLETNLQSTTTEKEELAKTVDVASTFSASNINIKGVDERKSGKEKETSTAKRVDKLLVTFDVENRVAKSGPADLYVIVTAPNGEVISDPSLGSALLTTRKDGDRNFTYKTTVEYEQGTRKTIQVPLRQQNFQTGNYKIEVYQNGFKITEGIRSLKKGGLFG